MSRQGGATSKVREMPRSCMAHDLAVQRMIQAGSVPNMTFAQIAESGLDWSSPQGAIMTEIFTWRQAELEKLKQG
jgi:hypothetical protein